MAKNLQEGEPVEEQSRELLQSLIVLRGVGGGSTNFAFHFVFFPTASFLPGERFSVVAVIPWITAIEGGVVNFHSDPSLP